VGPALCAEEADVGGVVLAAAVGASGDVDPHAADFGQPFVLQLLADGLGEAARLGDGDVAGVGTGAGDDVAGQLGAGTCHADGLEPFEQDRQLGLGEAAVDDVLAVAQAHVGAELALDRGERAELVGRDVAECRVRDC
jgi:hypothetical protein